MARLAVALLLLAALCGDAQAQNANCAWLKSLVAAVRQTEQRELRLAGETMSKLEAAVKASQDARIKTRATPTPANIQDLASKNASEKHLLASHAAAVRLSNEAHEFRIKLEVAIGKECDQAAVPPPQTPPPAVTPPVAQPVPPTPTPPPAVVPPAIATAYTMKGATQRCGGVAGTGTSFEFGVENGRVGGSYFMYSTRTLLIEGTASADGLLTMRVPGATPLIILVGRVRPRQGGGWEATGTMQTEKCVSQWAATEALLQPGVGPPVVPPPPPPGPGSRSFATPMFNDRYGVTNCLDHGGVGCGQPAADAFCVLQGYARSTAHKVVYGPPTGWIINARMACDDPGCARLADVTCVRP